MSTNNKISLITINYDSSNHLKRLLESIGRKNTLINEIIIINNSPEDIIKVSKFKKTLSCKIRYFVNKTNVGFSKAVNQGTELSKNSIVLIVNPDCMFTNDYSIKNLHKTLLKENTNIIVGGKLYKNLSGKIQKSAIVKINFLNILFEFTNLKKIWPNNQWSKSFWLDHSHTKKSEKVTALCGAFFMFKKDKINTIHLDESYFMYLEDLDLGIRMNNLNYNVIYVPNSSIIHFGGGSSKNKYKTDLRNWYKSRRIFIKKYFPLYQYIILMTIFMLEEKILQLYHYLKNEPAY